MNILRFLAAPTFKRRKFLCERIARDFLREDESALLQLERLNRVWEITVARVPYYRKLKKERELPLAFSSLADFSKRVPALTKADVQRLGNDVFDLQDKRSLHWSSTGGSTSEPVRIPKKAKELEVTEANEWYFRSKLGIKPEDPYFRLWGHSHRLGTGLKKHTRVFKRKLKDRALGMIRMSAYDLSAASVCRGLQAMVGSRATYAYGYSRAWERYAAMLVNQPEWRTQMPPLKCIIATSETFSSTEARQAVENAFGFPVRMEYGSEETGPIAQELQPGDYLAAWPAFYLEAVDVENGTGRLLVTSLYPGAFPLLRYDLGDLVSGFDQKQGMRRFAEILGRANEVIQCPDGTLIHSMPIAHVLRVESSILRFQVVLSRGVVQELLLVGQSSQNVDKRIEAIRHKLSQVNLSLGQIPVRVVNDVRTTPAGKRPGVYMEV